MVERGCIKIEPHQNYCVGHVGLEHLDDHLSTSGLHDLLAVLRRPETQSRDGSASGSADAGVSLHREAIGDQQPKVGVVLVSRATQAFKSF